MAGLVSWFGARYHGNAGCSPHSTLLPDVMPAKSSPTPAAAKSARAAATAETVDAVRRLVRALRLAARGVEGAAGVSSAQLFVLAQLADGVPASLGELAERTLTDRSSVAAVVDRLAERRLVVRGTSAEDRRRAAVRITAAGTALLRRAPRAPTAQLIDALERFGDAELQALTAGLTLLTDRMGLSGGRPPMLFEEEAGAGRSRRTAAARRPASRRKSPRG